LTAQSFKGRILISDLDGTLLDSSRRISRENLEAIERFRKGGGLFTLATGRMFMAIEPYMSQVELDMPAVIFNGAAIYDFKLKKVLWQQCLKDSVEQAAQLLLDEFPEMGMEVLYDDRLYVIRNNVEIVKHVSREGFSPIMVDSLKGLPRPWFKILNAWEPDKLVRVKELLESVPGYGTVFRCVYSEPQFLEILDAGVSKGKALERLLAMEGLDKAKTVAVGDNMNDMELVTTAAKGVAVGNAHEELKKAAGFICRDNDSSAVAHVIELMEEGLL
jgi:Cof subfamily protein (haloacid dehalogenase superfamily)